LPKKENIKAIINRNSLTKPVYIGDTQGDYEAATANKIPFIYSSYGFGLIDYHDYTVNNFSEILNIMNIIEKEF